MTIIIVLSFLAFGAAFLSFYLWVSYGELKDRLKNHEYDEQRLKLMYDGLRNDLKNIRDICENVIKHNAELCETIKEMNGKNDD